MIDFSLCLVKIHNAYQPVLGNLSSGEPKDNYAQNWSKYVKKAEEKKKWQKHSILAEELANITTTLPQNMK